MMRIVWIGVTLGALALAACGADGEPERPAFLPVAGAIAVG